MVGIYKITNLINHKIYIGQSVNIARRFQEHCCKHSLAIDQAIQKYGKQNFSFDVIEECPIERLNERERYWIKYYNSFSNAGYNQHEGGSIQYGSYNGNTVLTDADVEYIRDCYNNRLRRNEVYKLYKDKISFSAFAQIWDGTTWRHIKPEVYTDANLRYYKSQPTCGALSDKALFTDSEVLALRKRYVNETAKQIYKDVSERCKFQTLQQLLWGKTYKNVPIYKKQEKKWINEACNDYPL